LSPFLERSMQQSPVNSNLPPPAYNLGSFRKIQVFKPFGSCLETWLIHGFWQFSDAPLTAPVVTRVTDVKVPADRTAVRAEIGRVQK
jgi:hypothetical protein